ncbi:MAG TPA: RNA polymerase sigma factor [Blastocatellia bacterium]|nr:RNA polymerase sigma factor [Blastocatellia bacterium]
MQVARLIPNMRDKKESVQPLTPIVSEERLTDDQLVSAALEGDDTAYKQLMDRHSQRVFSIIGSYFKQPDLREEIAQDVFVKAYFALKSYGKGERFDAWLARIAVNRCYDELRRRKRHPEMSFTDITDDEDTWLEGAVAKSAKETFKMEQGREVARDLAEKLLATLPADDRLVLSLIDGEDYSLAEVADMTGWTVGKIKMKAMRARRRLSETLGRLLDGRKTKRPVLTGK